jgi:hypothetical protein
MNVPTQPTPPSEGTLRIGRHQLPKTARLLQPFPLGRVVRVLATLGSDGPDFRLRPTADSASNHSKRGSLAWGPQQPSPPGTLLSGFGAGGGSRVRPSTVNLTLTLPIFGPGYFRSGSSSARGVPPGQGRGRVARPVPSAKQFSNALPTRQ